MTNNAIFTPVAVIGAGPYGISVAAHLKSAGVEFRIFGKPMSRWLRHMPHGMFLKSEGLASSLSDPSGRHTLAHFCAAEGIPYRDTGQPVPLSLFCRYAQVFQRDLVPEVEEVMVSRIEQDNGAFELQLADGATIRAGKVIVATGLDHAAHIPAEIADLPHDLWSHSSAHHDLGRFQGMDVVVIGGGQSALETAALLSEQGAAVRLLVRAAALSWNSPPKTRQSRYARFRYPMSGLGAGVQLWAYANAPWLFRYLPEAVRSQRVKNVLGPAGGWWLKERVIDRFPVRMHQMLSKAEARGNRAVLHIRGGDGRMEHLTADHVIAATGYRFDLARLPFLSAQLKSLLRTQSGVPVLSTNFESSVPGVYFTGFASALWFGPVMRFLVGADYTARRISRHLAAALLQKRSLSNWELAHAVKSGQS